MARYLFGYTPGDFVVNLAGATLAPKPNAVGTVWTAKSGGAQLSDLLAADGTTATVTVTSESDGRVGFYGPSGVVTCWVDFGGGRYRMDASGTPVFGDGSTAVLVPRPVRVDSRDWQIDHTGVADSTTQMTNMLASSTSGAPTEFVIGRGKVKVTGKLTVPFAPYTTIGGCGPGQTIIESTATDKPIFEAGTDNTHSVTIRGMTLQYSAQRTDPACVAIRVHAPGGGGAGYWWLLEDLYISKAYDGFAVAADDGQQAFWGSVFRKVNFYGMKHSAVSLAPAAAVGNPALRFDHVGVFNTGPNAPSGGATGPAFNFTACEAVMDAIDVEGWDNDVIYASGGGYCTVRGLHVESHRWSAATSRVLFVANGVLDVQDFNITGVAQSTNTTLCAIAAPNVGSTLRLAYGSHNVDTTASTAGTKEVVYCGPGVPSINVDWARITKAGGGLNQPGPAAAADGLTSLPIYGTTSSLPTAAVAYRGQTWIVLGAGGVADNVATCRKSAGDTYSWVSLTGTDTGTVNASAVTTSRNLTSGDAGAPLDVNSTSDVTITIPTGLPQMITEVSRRGTGNVIIAAGAGVTLRYASDMLPRVRARYGAIGLRHLPGAEEWLVTGDLAAA